MRLKKFKILFWGYGNRAKTILSMINSSQGFFEYKNKKILNYEISIVNLNRQKYQNNHLNKKNYKIIEDQKSLKSGLLSSNSFIVAVGGTSGNFRFSLSKRLIKDYKLKPISFCSKDYLKDKSISFGEGYQIMKNVTINSNVKIGDFCILNTSSTIDHDCKINNGVHLMPGSTLAGNVTIENFSSIGSGSTIIPDILIGENSLIGAGTVVIRNVKKNQVVVGNPGNLLRSNLKIKKKFYFHNLIK